MSRGHSKRHRSQKKKCQKRSQVILSFFLVEYGFISHRQKIGPVNIYRRCLVNNKIYAVWQSKCNCRIRIFCVKIKKKCKKIKHTSGRRGGSYTHIYI